MTCDHVGSVASPHRPLELQIKGKLWVLSLFYVNCASLAGDMENTRKIAKKKLRVKCQQKSLLLGLVLPVWQWRQN